MSKGKRENKDNNMKLNIFFKICSIAFVVITVFFYIKVLNTNMVPELYFAIFTGVEVVLTLIILIGLARKREAIKLNILTLILAIMISAIYLLASNYINSTMTFLSSVFSEVKETDEYYVVVRNNNTYTKIEDINGKTIIEFNMDSDMNNKITEKVAVEFKEAESLTEMGNALVQGNEDVIFVNNSQYNMLADEIEKFKINTKILYKIQKQMQTSASLIEDTSGYTIKDEVFNIYISGIDTEGNINNVARSDANIIATVNTRTHEILLTSIPRDYYVTLHSKNAKDKLTHSGIYGIRETVNTVEDLLGIEINYYIRVNFTTVIKLVDTLGGVDVYSEYDFTSVDDFRYHKGINHLNGEEALSFSRERDAFTSGDHQRIKDQQYVIKAIIDKIMDGPTILTKYTSILNTLQGSFQTNIDQDDISNIVKAQLEKMPSWSVENFSLTGTGSYKSTYSVGKTLLYVMEPDKASVAEAKEKIETLLSK